MSGGRVVVPLPPCTTPIPWTPHLVRGSVKTADCWRRLLEGRGSTNKGAWAQRDVSLVRGYVAVPLVLVASCSSGPAQREGLRAGKCTQGWRGGGGVSERPGVLIFKRRGVAPAKTMDWPGFGMPCCGVALSEVEQTEHAISRAPPRPRGIPRGPEAPLSRLSLAAPRVRAFAQERSRPGQATGAGDHPGLGRPSLSVLPASQASPQ